MPKPKFDHVRRRTSDPLSAAMLPPANESPVDRENRLKAEQEARKVSESIDDMLRQERKDRIRTRPEVNVLLLGQSESGKSTTLKRESSFPCPLRRTPTSHRHLSLHLLPVSLL
jgi:guanine nucleotide-binding protein subunit alpha